jgi:uncharacterized protein with NRDE domain
MCTLIVLDRVVPGVPVLVASNRDEYYRRPSAPPTVVVPRGAACPGYVAPQDLKAGGTWMGVNDRGLFVGITNRASAEPRADRSSRGLLVLDSLRRESADAIRADLAPARLEGVYNPFHLFCADGRSAHLTVLREDGAETRALRPGAHVICNRDPDDPASCKVRDLQAAVAAIDLGRPIEELLDQLAGLLSVHPHADDPLRNPCVHTPDYGTRSSTLIALGARQSCYRHSDGPPCEAKYQDLSSLLDGLQITMQSA